jgi:hypothetical protein
MQMMLSGRVNIRHENGKSYVPAIGGIAFADDERERAKYYYSQLPYQPQACKIYIMFLCKNATKIPPKSPQHFALRLYFASKHFALRILFR